MCGKSLKPVGSILLLSLLLLLLSWWAWPLPLNSQETIQVEKADWELIQKTLSELRKDLENLRLINSQQADKISLLQTTIDQQAPLLTAQKLNLMSLTESLESTKTVNTIITTAGIISILGNIAQAIAYGVKK
jgi:hypothetical protein